MKRRPKPKGNTRAKAARRSTPGKGHAGGRRVAAFRNRTGEPSLGEAMGLAPIGAIAAAAAVIGPVEVTTDGALAIAQLNELAILFADVAEAEAEHTKKADAAKVAKKRLDGAVSVFTERFRTFTHPPAPLPLFEAGAEAVAVADMIAGDLLPPDPPVDAPPPDPSDIDDAPPDAPPVDPMLDRDEVPF